MRCESCRKTYPPGDLYDGDLCRDCALEVGVDLGEPVVAIGRSCAVCGVVISGYSNRRTCSTRCRVALHRRNRKAAA